MEPNRRGDGPTTTPAAAPAGHQAKMPHRLLLVLLAGLIVLLAAGALLARDVIRIRHDLSTGQALLGHLQLSDVDSRQSIEDTLGTADRQLRAGANLTHDSIWLTLVAELPKAGTQVRAARILTGSAARVGDIAYQGALKARAQLDAPRSGPADRLRVVDAIRQDLADAKGQLAQVPTHADGHLISPLAKAQAVLVNRLAQANTQMTDALAMTTTLRTMLAGPRTYLVLAGNNAEMRSGGITTSAGLIHFQGGDMTTGQFISSFDLYLPDSKRVPVPDDINHLYGWMAPGQEWRTTDTSPNWPAVAQVYAQMSANSPFGKVDGVLFVDVVTLRSVLSVLGPVTVNGFKYSADNVLTQVLYTNYLLFPTADQTNTRRDVQSNVARATFAALRDSKFSIPDLAHELKQDAKGRHLLAWSSSPTEENLWIKLGADGNLAPDGFMVSVQNVSASKLDYFIRPVVTLQTQQLPDHQQIEMYVTVTNPRRPTSSPYIEGGTDCCVVPGDQRIYLLLYLPASAYNITSYKPEFSTGGTDGPMRVAGVIYVVPYGQTSTIHFSFQLPLSQTSVNLLPSARVQPVQYVINGVPGTNDGVYTRVGI